MASSKKYISREDKRELGIPVNIWDAARSLNEHRMDVGEESRPLRQIIKEEDFRNRWNVWRNRQNTFLERVNAAEYWGWWEYDDDDREWRYVG